VLTFNVTVTNPNGTGNGILQPTGAVALTDGNAAVCTTGNLTQATTGSTASCSVPNTTVNALTVGTHKIVATYTPATTDTNYVTAASSPPTQVIVTKATPTIAVALTTGTSTSVYGTSLTFTATVTGVSGVAQPTGSVTFSDGTNSINASCTNTNPGVLTPGTANSTATCKIASLTGGTHMITATYVPGSDPNYSAVGPSTPPLPQTVTKATPTITVALTTGNSTSVYGTSLTFTATVTGIRHLSTGHP
jgi:hypothetical protein